MDKEFLRSAFVVFGGIFVGWIVCMTVLAQYATSL
jgi:hypothetical protein